MQPKVEGNNEVNLEREKLANKVREFVESKGLYVYEPDVEEGELYRVQVLEQPNTRPIWGEPFNSILEEMKNSTELQTENLEITHDPNVGQGIIHIVFKARQK